MIDAPFSHLVTSEAELREGGYPPPGRIPLDKEIAALDSGCEQFLAQSPLCLLATADAGGRTTASPRGGPPGFVRVLDPKRIAWADLTGNRRLDAFRQILENPQVGLLFLVPGLRETLRIDGTAYLTRDPEILRATDVPGRTADLAVGVHVRTAFLQCGKAMIRSALWQPETWPSPEELPAPGALLRAHLADQSTAEEITAALEDDYTRRLW